MVNSPCGMLGWNFHSTRIQPWVFAYLFPARVALHFTIHLIEKGSAWDDVQEKVFDIDGKKIFLAKYPVLKVQMNAGVPVSLILRDQRTFTPNDYRNFYYEIGKVLAERLDALKLLPLHEPKNSVTPKTNEKGWKSLWQRVKSIFQSSPDPKESFAKMFAFHIQPWNDSHLQRYAIEIQHIMEQTLPKLANNQLKPLPGGAIRKFADDEGDKASAWLRKEAKSWTSIVTSAEKQALNMYTGGYSTQEDNFSEMQKQLREHKGDPGSSTNIQRLNALFEKMKPLSEDIIVYRGNSFLGVPGEENAHLQNILEQLYQDMENKFQLTPTDYESFKMKYPNWEKAQKEKERETGKELRYAGERHQQFQENYNRFKTQLEGQMLTEYGYMSTSPLSYVADGFGSSFLLELHVPKGTKAIAITGGLGLLNGEKNELLLPSGTRYKIKNVEIIPTINPFIVKKIKITAEVENVTKHP